MKKIFIGALLLSGILIMQSCYYDKADLLYPQQAVCDTAGTISYSQQIMPLFQQHCYPCHTAASPDGGIILGIYISDKVIAQNGKLYGSVSYSPGYSPMPQGKAKLSNCQLATIKKWIDAGSPNN